MNQIVLAHELRHALQDQYADLHALLTGTSSDFDDRRLAILSLFEGDATLVMERFVKLRLGVLAAAAGLGDAAAGGAALAPGLADVPGAPPVVRDQLVQPYLAGLTFARAIFGSGGGDALREAWGKPPQSSEQVLHPELFFAGEAPRAVTPRLTRAPGGGCSQKACWASCCCARCSRARARRRRVGAATAGSSGTCRDGPCRPGAASGTHRPTRASSTTRCCVASPGCAARPR